MADRFLASYEDDFTSRPNSGQGRSAVMPRSPESFDPRYNGAPRFQQPKPEWREPDWPESQSSAPSSFGTEWRNPSESYDPAPEGDYAREAAYSAPASPMFAPLDRRALPKSGDVGQSYPRQSYAGRAGNPHPWHDPNANAPRDEDRAYDAPRDEDRAYDAPRDEDRAYNAPRDEDRAYNAPRDEGRAYGHNTAAYGQPERRFVTPVDRMVRMTQWAGTICSILVLLGAVYWAYELAVRDARGIPVVRAAEGPLRIAPATPGGEISANQGLAVNAVAAKGGSAPLPDVVTLAPAPTVLTQEDVADTISAEAPVPENATDAPEAAAVLAEPVASDLADLTAKTPDVMPMSDEAAVEAALAMALSEGNEPVTKSNTDAAQPADLATSEVPSPDLRVPVAAVAAPPTSEVDPANIPAGTKLVQLGAFDDDAAARAAWAGLQTQFSDLIGTKSLVVQQAKSGGRVFYRLRAFGFADEDETRRFCAALLAENASCIPVSQR